MAAVIAQALGGKSRIRAAILAAILVALWVLLAKQNIARVVHSHTVQCREVMKGETVLRNDFLRSFQYIHKFRPTN